MGKKKKKLTKRINPEKSNKMIYAVGGGLLLLFLIAVLFVLNSDQKREEDPVLKTIDTLKESNDILMVKRSQPQSNTLHVVIKEKGKEVMKLIKGEAIELSGVKRDVEYEIIIALQSIDNPVYSLKVKDHEISNFRSIRKED